MRAGHIMGLIIATLCSGCSGSPASRSSAAGDNLVGAWRGTVQFSSGALAAVRDLEFLYVFNAGGTMTESSNYDAAPPVPPAYGIWRQTGPRQFEAQYVFYVTQPPATLDELSKGNGWSPAGRGVLRQTITLSADGRTFDSTLRYDVVDGAGKPVETHASATARATRMEFQP
jgi:hypothetical protein